MPFRNGRQEGYQDECSQILFFVVADLSLLFHVDRSPDLFSFCHLPAARYIYININEVSLLLTAIDAMKSTHLSAAMIFCLAALVAATTSSKPPVITLALCPTSTRGDGHPVAIPLLFTDKGVSQNGEVLDLLVAPRCDYTTDCVPAAAVEYGDQVIYYFLPSTATGPAPQIVKMSWASGEGRVEQIVNVTAPLGQHLPRTIDWMYFHPEERVLMTIDSFTYGKIDPRTGAYTWIWQLTDFFSSLNAGAVTFNTKRNAFYITQGNAADPFASECGYPVGGSCTVARSAFSGHVLEAHREDVSSYILSTRPVLDEGGGTDVLAAGLAALSSTIVTGREDRDTARMQTGPVCGGDTTAMSIAAQDVDVMDGLWGQLYYVNGAVSPSAPPVHYQVDLASGSVVGMVNMSALLLDECYLVGSQMKYGPVTVIR